MAEVARLAPAGKIGPMTGAVLSFAGAGQVALPLVFGGILGATGSYGLGFVLVALPALATGVVLVRRRPEPRPDRLRRKRIR